MGYKSERIEIGKDIRHLVSGKKKQGYPVSVSEDQTYRFATGHADMQEKGISKIEHAPRNKRWGPGKYAFLSGSFIFLSLIAGLGLEYYPRTRIDKDIETAAPPAYRSLTNGSLVLHPIGSEWEAKNLNQVLGGCAKKLGMKTEELGEIINNGHQEIFGQPLDLGNLKAGDKIPFPPECE